jgi:uncharacterized protein (TIGR03083 family)
MQDVMRQEALGTLRDGDAQVQELLGGLTPEQMTRPATIGGGDWSAKDLVGHLAFWEELALSALTVWKQGAEPDTVGAMDEVNAANHVRKAKWSLERVLAERREVNERLMREIEGLSDREWSAPPPKSFARRESLGARLGGLTGAADGMFRHAFAHLGDLRAYVASLA